VWLSPNPLGNKYDGEWDGDLMSGFLKGEMEGFGTAIYSNEEKYTGFYKNNKRSGHGVLSWTCGDVFEGEFLDDERVTGEMKYANGDVYRGEWENKKRHGKGEYTWSCGDSFNGRFRQDVKHGQGFLVCANGFRVNQNFRYGRAVDLLKVRILIVVSFLLINSSFYIPIKSIFFIHYLVPIISAVRNYDIDNDSLFTLLSFLHNDIEDDDRGIILSILSRNRMFKKDNINLE
jgi:hypothetical protein